MIGRHVEGCDNPRCQGECMPDKPPQRLTADQIVAQAFETMQALRDTIEQALNRQHVVCKAVGHPLVGHRCRVLAVLVDAYMGVALQLASLEGATVDFLKPKTYWLPAKEVELPLPQPWESWFHE